MRVDEILNDLEWASQLAEHFNFIPPFGNSLVDYRYHFISTCKAVHAQFCRCFYRDAKMQTLLVKELDVLFKAIVSNFIIPTTKNCWV